jgi:hypothetical protein
MSINPYPLLCEKQAQEIALLNNMNNRLLTSAGVDDVRGLEIIKLRAEIAEKAQEIEGLQASARFWQDKAGKFSEEIAEKDRKLAIEARIRLNGMTKPAVGHDYWERFFQAKYEVELESIKAAERQAGRDEIVALIIRPNPAQPTDERK